VGLAARCFVHETDHNDGILFIRHLSPLKRELVLRKFRKDEEVNGKRPTPSVSLRLALQESFFQRGQTKGTSDQVPSTRSTNVRLEWAPPTGTLGKHDSAE